jgi:hypothetical protein
MAARRLSIISCLLAVHLPSATAAVGRMGANLVSLVKPWSPKVRVGIPMLALSCMSVAGPMGGGGGMSVSESGAATYTLPVSVVPGTSGMEPRLAFTYSSQAGNGMLGLGWNLSGLSFITRCPRTMAQDGVRGAVDFTASDRFCLDGQRLMLVSGTYGADGAVYRTEQESFNKIVSYGTAGSGPAWFKVWTKSGLTLEYGNTPDSRIEAQGKASVRTWAMNKTSDAKGNYLAFSYIEDTVNGDFSPSRIDYSGNAATGLATAQSVQFVYEPRSDVQPLYMAGSLIKATARLKTVATYVGSTKVSEYRLGYSSATSPRYPQLLSITKCSGSGDCLNPVSFTWQTPAAALGAEGDWGSRGAAYHPDIKGFKLADMNGDGLEDLVYEADNGQIRVLLSTAGSFAADALWGARTQSYNQEVKGFQLADVNGDGRPDVVYESSSTQLRVLLNTGTGLSADANWGARSASYNPDLKGFKLLDMNGDGRADVVYEASNAAVRVVASTGTAFGPDASWGIRTQSYNPEFRGSQFADLDGNGLPDLVYEASNGATRVLLNSGTSLGADQNWDGRAAAYNPEVIGFQLADLNGDGLADMVYEASNGVLRVRLSRGNSFAPDADWGSRASAYNSAKKGFSLTDTDGDGLPDLVYDATNNQARVVLNRGTSFGADTVWGTRAASYNPEVVGFQLADLNGDGVPDMVYEASNGVLWARQSGDAGMGRIVSFNSEFQASTAVAYLPLTKASVYTKDGGSNAAQYPVIDLQPAMYVVSQVQVPNSLGGHVTTTYKYGGLKAELGTGRVMLGFRWTSSKNVDTGIENYVEFRQDWPFIGMAAKSETRLAGSGNGGLLKRATTTYAQGPGSASPAIFVYASQSTEESWDLNGVQLPTLTTTSQYSLSPQYGDPTQIQVTVSDGSSKTTVNEYWPAQTGDGQWILGRLKKATVTSTKP